MAEESERTNGYDPAGAAIFANSTRALHFWVRSTGFRTHGLRYRSLSHSNDARIAEDFLLNSRSVRQDRELEASVQSYFFDPGVVTSGMLGQEDMTGIQRVNLPTGVRLRRELGDVLGQRRSQRTYTGDPLPQDYLATIVRSAGAITGQTDVDLMGGGHVTVRFRTAPSGGGLYPIDIYVASLRVDGLERGLYRYDPLSDTLMHSGNREDVDELLSTFSVPEELITLAQANVIFLLVGHPWRSMRKYGSRGTRFLFLEAGSIAQNVHLATEALGFGSVDCASVYDDEAHEVMRLDGLYQTLLHTIIVGNPG